MGRLAEHVSGYLREGSDGRLAERALLPVALRVLEGLGDIRHLSQQNRACYVDGLQADLRALFRSEELATTVRILGALRASPHRVPIETQLAAWLHPGDPSGLRDSLLKVSAGLIQTPVPYEALTLMWPYFERVLDPEITDGPAIIHMVDTILAGDRDGVFLDMLRRAVDQGADGTRDAPVATLVDAYGNALAIAPDQCTPEQGLTARGLESAIRTLLGFLQDEQYGLPAIFEALELMAAQGP